jgi:hypothetical protein
MPAMQGLIDLDPNDDHAVWRKPAPGAQASEVPWFDHAGVQA